MLALVCFSDRDFDSILRSSKPKEAVSLPKDGVDGAIDLEEEPMVQEPVTEPQVISLVCTCMLNVLSGCRYHVKYILCLDIHKSLEHTSICVSLGACNSN